MKRLTDERFAKILSDKETCEFCADGDNDKACLGCKKINPATATELRLFWKELSALVKARDEGRVLPEKSMWTTTCDGRKLVLVMDVRAAQDGEAAFGGGGDG